jgi:hypothetical protein
VMIGGHDIIIDVPPRVPVADLILERVRRLWPDARFRDAEEEDHYAIHDPQILIRGARSKEFLIYRDPAAVEAWDREGATPANLDTMLYFIIGDDVVGRDSPRELTLVCGKKTREIRRLIDDLTKSFSEVSSAVAERISPDVEVAGSPGRPDST